MEMHVPTHTDIGARGGGCAPVMTHFSGDDICDKGLIYTELPKNYVNFKRRGEVKQGGGGRRSVYLILTACVCLKGVAMT